VLEYLDNDLQSWLLAQPGHRVTETVAQQLMRQLAQGMFHLRALNVVHRNLSTSNIGCYTCEAIPTLKISGFALVRVCSNSDMLQSFDIQPEPFYMVCVASALVLCALESEGRSVSEKQFTVQHSHTYIYAVCSRLSCTNKKIIRVQLTCGLWESYCMSLCMECSLSLHNILVPG
jgi:hypothetical protein